jgi:ferredoxin
MFWQLDLRKTTIASFAGCPYSCVKRAPHAFAFADDTGTAHASSQGHYDDYNVQLAVGQCPRKCIYYVTPCQRTILEEILASVLMTPYDLSEAAVLDSLLSKAMFENNRYKKPKRETKSSSDYVDWM